MTNQIHNGTGNNVVWNGDFIDGTIQQRPSILAEVINALGARLFVDGHANSGPLTEFQITDKISYNNVIKYQEVFEKQKVYQGKLNVIYNELDDLASHKKSILLRNIHNLYLKVKGEFIAASPDVTEQEIICANSDKIIENIEKQLISEVATRCSNIQAYSEAIEVGVLIVMVDAFMRCKILEEPKK